VGGGLDWRVDRCYSVRVDLQVIPGDENASRFYVGISMPVRRTQ